jgi:hypothetical protein
MEEAGNGTGWRVNCAAVQRTMNTYTHEYMKACSEQLSHCAGSLASLKSPTGITLEIKVIINELKFFRN